MHLWGVATVYLNSVSAREGGGSHSQVMTSRWGSCRQCWHKLLGRSAAPHRRPAARMQWPRYFPARPLSGIVWDWDFIRMRAAFSRPAVPRHYESAFCRNILLFHVTSMPGGWRRQLTLNILLQQLRTTSLIIVTDNLISELIGNAILKKRARDARIRIIFTIWYSR